MKTRVLSVLSFASSLMFASSLVAETAKLQFYGGKSCTVGEIRSIRSSPLSVTINCGSLSYVLKQLETAQIVQLTAAKTGNLKVDVYGSYESAANQHDVVPYIIDTL